MVRICIKLFVTYSFIIYSIILPRADLYGQDTCAEILTRAEQNYFEGRFDDTISLVKSCLARGSLDQSGLVRAYKILAQAYLAKNHPEAAGKIVTTILEIDPNYNPTIETEPPPFVELVNSIRQEKLQAEMADQQEDNKWLWIGAAGVATVGIITIIVLSTGDNDDQPEPLPAPPQWPED